MKIKSSRRYYFPLYLLFLIIAIFFPNFLSLASFILLILAIEVYINTHYMEIKNNGIYVYQGIINRKNIKIEGALVNEVMLEKNIYLYLTRTFYDQSKGF